MAIAGHTLSYAVRTRVVLHHGGLMALALVPLPLVAAGHAWLHDASGLALRLAGVAALLGLGGAAMRRVRYRGSPELNEIMVLAALGFIVPSILFGWALAASGVALDSAIFEAVSGMTTTGLTALAPAETLHPTVVFTRAWMQWYGGLGIVILAMALVAGRESAAARRLAETERPGEDLIGSMRSRARRMVVIYGVLTVGCLGSLIVAGTPPYQALLYAFTAVSTAGFAPHSDSLGALPGWLPRVLVMAWAFAGAVSFTVYLSLWRRQRPVRAGVLELAALVGCTTLAVAGVCAALAAHGDASAETLLGGALVAVSAQTTTGFSALDVSGLPGEALGVLMIAMAIGGNTGSTAGGFKSLRLLLVMALLGQARLRPSLPPDAVTLLRFAGSRVQREEVESLVALAALGIATIVLAWLPFLAAGYGIPALFDVVSAVATTGLSAGVTGPDLAPGLKLVLCAAMILGRLEFVAVLVLLSPGTWTGARHVT